jgi:hypothetical protein
MLGGGLKTSTFLWVKTKSGERMAVIRKNKRAFRLLEYLKALDFIMVPEVGIEPTCPCERGILSRN